MTQNHPVCKSGVGGGLIDRFPPNKYVLTGYNFMMSSLIFKTIQIQVKLYRFCYFRILKAHLHTTKHLSNDKLVYCGEEGCEKAYTRVTSLRVHVRLVHKK
jgi:hypothetical protein